LKKDLKYLSPDFPRIPHLDETISNMESDDIKLNNIIFPLECWAQEKVDGSNVGISWMNNEPFLRTREKILRKEYSKTKNLTKSQYVPLWNWIYSHKKDILKIVNKIGICTIYGEWLMYEHSIGYDKLPDYFLSYDIWSYELKRFLEMGEFEKLISSTNIHYIKPEKYIFNNIDEIKIQSEKTSLYRNDIVEGIVLKNTNFLSKVVNNKFIRKHNFNDKRIKNKLIK
jgi:hypothetical protein